MRIALITDTHWGVRNDSSTFIEYYRKFYNETFFPYLKENDISTIIHLGDIVDRRKYIAYTSLRAMNEIFMEPAKNYDLHIIIGNHDVPYKNTNDVNAMQEVYGAGVNWYSETTEVNFDGCNILLVPWINSENYERSIQMINATRSEILMGHLEVAGCLMQRGMINPHGLELDTFKNFDMVMSGHFHTRSKTKNVHYLGCPYELTWSDYQDQKGFHIFDTDTRELEFVKNPLNMFHKIWYSDEGKTLDEIMDNDFSAYEGTYVKVIKQTNQNPYHFDMFMDELYKSNPANLQLVDDHLNLDLDDDDDIVNEAEDTATILSNYIDSLNTTVDKKRLDTLMRTLYNEALHVE